MNIRYNIVNIASTPIITMTKHLFLQEPTMEVLLQQIDKVTYQLLQSLSFHYFPISFSVRTYSFNFIFICQRFYRILNLLSR